MANEIKLFLARFLCFSMPKREIYSKWILLLLAYINTRALVLHSQHRIHRKAHTSAAGTAPFCLLHIACLHRKSFLILLAICARYAKQRYNKYCFVHDTWLINCYRISKIMRKCKLWEYQILVECFRFEDATIQDSQVSKNREIPARQGEGQHNLCKSLMKSLLDATLGEVRQSKAKVFFFLACLLQRGTWMVVTSKEGGRSW